MGPRRLVTLKRVRSTRSSSSRTIRCSARTARDQPGGVIPANARNDADRRLQPPAFRSAAISMCRPAAPQLMIPTWIARPSCSVSTIRATSLGPELALTKTLHRGRGHRRLRSGRLRTEVFGGRCAQPRRSLRRDRPELLGLRLHFRLAGADHREPHVQRDAPSLNVVMEVTDSFLIRAAAAKVMWLPTAAARRPGSAFCRRAQRSASPAQQDR